MGKQLSKVEILALHQALYEELTATQREEFLTRPELAELTGLTAASVHHALVHHRRLADALLAALTVDSWFSGEPCEDDAIPWCARCKPTDMPSTVVASTSGFASAFHRSRRCELLIGGQAKVIRRGGDSAAVESVNLQAALGRGLLPCQGCFKPS